MTDRARLDNLGDLVVVLSTPAGSRIIVQGGAIRMGQMYCPSCGDIRRMYVTVLSTPLMSRNIARDRSTPLLPQIIPSLLMFICVQCDAPFTAVIHDGPGGPALAVLPGRPGGLSTPHTPAGVRLLLGPSAQVAVSRGQ